jgi:hypothetical protein
VDITIWRPFARPDDGGGQGPHGQDVRAPLKFEALATRALSQGGGGPQADDSVMRLYQSLLRGSTARHLYDLGAAAEPRAARRRPRTERTTKVAAPSAPFGAAHDTALAAAAAAAVGATATNGVARSLAYAGERDNGDAAVSPDSEEDKKKKKEEEEAHVGPKGDADDSVASTGISADANASSKGDGNGCERKRGAYGHDSDSEDEQIRLFVERLGHDHQEDSSDSSECEHDDARTSSSSNNCANGNTSDPEDESAGRAGESSAGVGGQAPDRVDTAAVVMGDQDTAGRTHSARRQRHARYSQRSQRRPPAVAGYLSDTFYAPDQPDAKSGTLPESVFEDDDRTRLAMCQWFAHASRSAFNSPDVFARHACASMAMLQCMPQVLLGGVKNEHRFAARRPLVLEANYLLLRARALLEPAQERQKRTEAVTACIAPLLHAGAMQPMPTWLAALCLLAAVRFDDLGAEVIGCIELVASLCVGL